MSVMLFCPDEPASLARGLRALGAVEPGKCEVRHFPDGESYVRVASDCRGRDTAILCALTPPDSWILPVIFLAETLRELGARSVGLIAPYLPYMRQDQRFQSGEAVSARLFAKVIAAPIDWLVTVDPHLHRFPSLDSLYPIPHRIVPAAPLLADWIRTNVRQPLLIGPDAESEQWVAAVAQYAQAPFVVLDKIRHGAREVSVTGSIGDWSGHTPVLVDDMVTTGHTLLEAAALLRAAGLGAPVCVAVHGLFVEHAVRSLRKAGIEHVATTNSVPHDSNAIDLSAPVAQALGSLQDECTLARNEAPT
jgi:ribose-phosphate pyrophosphokinase